MNLNRIHRTLTFTAALFCTLHAHGPRAFCDTARSPNAETNAGDSARVSYDLPVKIEMPAGSPAANARMERRSCVIVDFSGDFGWKGFPALGGGRDESLRGKLTKQDLDGDAKKNDSIDYLAFSMDAPFNPAPSAYRLHDVHNAVFYGGGVGFFHNREPRLSEYCINMDWCDTVSFNGYAPDAGQGLRVFAAWIWKKKDFLNRGDAWAVSFDEDSMMYVHVTRYWKDYQEGRFIAQQGGQLYLSQFRFGGIPSTARSGAPNNDKVYSVCPAKTRWAKWDPKAPYDMEYDPSQLEFKEVKFDDVEAVGWISTRYRNDGPASCWLKWAGFDVHATVSRPWRPSEHVNMIKTFGRDFHISDTEIDYRTWRKISNWSFKQVWAHMPTYVYDRKGDMGSMDYGDDKHSPNEPVTDITWTDAVAWCNALSEYEGLAPCYYSDAGRKQVFRRVRDRLSQEEYDVLPKVYVDWAADGYRLPSKSEWVVAAKGETFSEERAWTGAGANGRTHEVGTKKPSASGLHDMFGNVWEYVWDTGCDEYDPARHQYRKVVGGGFRYPEDASRKAGIAAGDMPGDGQYNIGFRVIRYVGGGKRPPLGQAPSASGYSAGPVPLWTYRRDEIIGTTDDKPTIDMSQYMADVPEGALSGDKRRMQTSISEFKLGKYEVSYRLWNQVHRWAVMNGCEFNFNGDMGSMRSPTGMFTYSPEEPVTHVNFSDMLIWCNALSEITGRTPVYYADEAKTRPLKKSIQYRWAIGERDREKRGWSPEYLSKYVFVKWIADGYRLPTEAERTYVYEKYRANSTRPTAPAKDENTYWLWSNSGGKTRPVGTSKPNRLGVFDLLGNVHERCWSTGKHLDDTEDPRADTFSGSVVGGSYYIQPDDNIHFMMSSSGGGNVYHAYSDIGFRIARSEADVLPDGKDRTPKVVLDFDPRAVDPLQGQMYRANNRRTGYFKAKGVPCLKGVKWKFKCGKGIGASPVVVDGVAYIGSLDGNFYAIDAETGKETWRFTTEDNAPIRSSAVVFQEKVFFVGNDQMLYALDAAVGTLKWKTPSLVKGGRDYDAGPSPTVVAGIVFCNGKQNLQGFDPDRGKVVWDARGVDAGLGVYALSYHPAGLLIRGGSSGYPGAVDLRIARGGGRVGGVAGDTFSLTAACDDKHAYVAGGMGLQKVLIADRPDGGSAGPVQFTYKEAHWNNMHPHFSPIGVDGGNVYIGNVDRCLYAVDIDTGKLSWKFQTGGPVQSGPSIAAGIVYVGSEDGHLYAIDAATGAERWNFKTGGKITHSSPWIGNGVVFVGSSDGYLYALL